MAKGKERLIGIYGGMKTRCTNKNCKDYKRYGGSEITVCNEWIGDGGFSAFYEWAMSHGYDDALSLDRIDGKSGYSPSNCRWSTPSEQARNKSNNHLIEYNGEVKTLIEWAESVGLRKDTFRRRIVNYGWTMEDALTTPNMKGNTKIGHEKWRQADSTKQPI